MKREILTIDRTKIEELHRKYITASQMPTILRKGYIPRETLLQEKVSFCPPREATIQMEVGLALEPFLFQKLCENMPTATLTRNDYERAYVYEDFLLAIPDFEGKDTVGRCFVGDIKTTINKDKHWEAFIIQVQTQILCSGADYGVLWCYDFNKGTFFEIIESTPFWQETIITEARNFQKEIEEVRKSGRLPEPQEEQPNEEQNAFLIDNEEQLKNIFIELAEIRSQKKALEDREKALKEEVERFMLSKNINSLINGTKRIAYFVERTQETLDKEALKRLLLSDYSQYVAKNTTRYLKLEV